MIDINKMTLKELRSLPYVGDKVLGEFDALLIVPVFPGLNRSMWHYLSKYVLSKLIESEATSFPELWEMPGVHDSGYRCMDYIPLRKNQPKGRLSGYSDSLAIDGIGGGGYGYLTGNSKNNKAKPWAIDCLEASGALRIWCSNHKLKIDSSLGSTLELFAIKKK